LIRQPDIRQPDIRQPDIRRSSLSRLENVDWSMDMPTIIPAAQGDETSASA
jgi:hypothetical protein